MEIETRIRKIIADQLGGSAEELTESTRFVEDIGADSLDTVELVMALEEEFNFEIPEETVTTLQTVGGVIDYVKTRTAGNALAPHQTLN